MRYPDRLVYVLIAATLLPLQVMAESSDAANELKKTLSRITGDDPDASRQAVRELATSDLTTIGQLTDMLVEPGKGNDADVRRVLHGLAIYVSRPGAGDERGPFTKALCGRLKTDRPVAVKCFLIRQLQIAGGPESVAPLSACLTDDELAESARQALVANASSSAVEALRKALPKTKGMVRIGIIQALGGLGDTASILILRAVAETVAHNTDEEARIAAIAALGRIGDIRAKTTITAFLEQGSARARRVAMDAYLRLAAQMLAKGTRWSRHRALAMYGNALTTTEPAMRCAALRGLSEVGGREATKLILSSIADDDTTVRHIALSCLAKMPEERVSLAIAEALANAGVPVRARLLHVLAERNDPEATAAIEAATKDPNAEIRLTAWDLQGRLDNPSADMASTLLDAATNGSSLIRPVALLAYLKLANTQLREGKEDLALPMYEQVLKLVGSDDFRRQALADLADAGSEKSLAITEGLINDESVRDDALRVYVGVARRVADAGNRQKAIAILRKTLAANPARPVYVDALQQLWILGADDDPARDAGFVTRWRVVGPLPGNDVHQVWPPEQGVDPAAKPVKIHDRSYPWTPFHTPDPQGIVDLAASMNPNVNTTAYLYAEVVVDEARDTVLKIGSNDGMKLWLNGKTVHVFPGSRSLTVDQDTVTTRLKAGVNKFLFKVTQNSGGWEACLRLTDQDGQPLRFKQEKE